MRKALEHDAIHQQRRCNPKRNQIRKRIEFTAEDALLRAKPGEQSVQEIEHARRHDERDGPAE